MAVCHTRHAHVTPNRLYFFGRSPSPCLPSNVSGLGLFSRTGCLTRKRLQTHHLSHTLHSACFLYLPLNQAHSSLLSVFPPLLHGKCGFLLSGVLLSATFFIWILKVLYTVLASIVDFPTAGSWCVLGFPLDLGLCTT